MTTQTTDIYCPECGDPYEDMPARRRPDGCNTRSAAWNPVARRSRCLVDGAWVDAPHLWDISFGDQPEHLAARLSGALGRSPWALPALVPAPLPKPMEILVDESRLLLRCYLPDCVCSGPESRAALAT